MKQQDIAVVLIIVFIAGIFTFIISNKFITPSNAKRTAEVVTPIDTSFPLPDTTVFNNEAVNPTVQIQIAPSNNSQPFSNQNQ